jgi:FkbM family methyltransferase
MPATAASPTKPHTVELQLRSSAGRPITIACADPDDWIPREIRRTGQLFEQPMIEDMAAEAHRSAAESGRPVCILDCGANIGNHTVYLAAVAGLRVLAVEPNTKAADLLDTNLRLNECAGLVTVARVALGRGPGRGSIAQDEPDNLAGARVVPAAAGPTFPIVTLDSLELPAAPAVMKLDIEGGEFDALAGARRTLAEFRPILYIECHGRERFEHMRDLLADPALGRYTPVARFNTDPTYKFMPTSTDAERSRAIAALGKLVWFGKFQRLDDRDTLEARLAAMQARIDELSRRLGDASR